jgi:hypothetical protein
MREKVRDESQPTTIETVNVPAAAIANEISVEL